jgi:hypothetical protein
MKVKTPGNRGATHACNAAFVALPTRSHTITGATLARARTRGKVLVLRPDHRAFA